MYVNLCNQRRKARETLQEKMQPTVQEQRECTHLFPSTPWGTVINVVYGISIEYSWQAGDKVMEEALKWLALWMDHGPRALLRAPYIYAFTSCFFAAQLGVEQGIE